MMMMMMMSQSLCEKLVSMPSSTITGHTGFCFLSKICLHKQWEDASLQHSCKKLHVAEFLCKGSESIHGRDVQMKN
jgi:hypothetical protein